ncbi:methyltransferase, TIGR04325 family [Leptolyngbya sp. 7M]|uniref:methyltransferase, TIGR04325 family n=1 Tax=Leptolyngbya sp. 7M TaxID=2812896 RepID=UPI001B8A9173|nr:methyltransferase, TIGR04325 family [Leptolyngbya sp. 7M]QYO62888.1 methyltransferase, TIGR04325 family [Leptolyngbya sp. 7M]
MKVGGTVIRGQKSGQNLKQSLRDLVLNIPLLSDLYLYYWVFPRSCAEYRGKFSSFSAALKSIPQKVSNSYNQAEFYRSHPTLSIEEINKFQPIDYPVLVWLREAFSDNSTVFDLGGNTGYSYYAYQKYISYPSSLNWKICDLPEAVNAGNEILKRFPSPGLSYTVNISDAEGCDIFLTCGTLQYLEFPLSELLQQLSTKPRHLIIHHVPFHSGKEYFTLQNLLSSYVPYKIQNRAEFLASLINLGYELVDSWEIDRTCRIPFHPECFVDAYHGFYLRLRGTTKPFSANCSASQSHSVEQAYSVT